MKNVGKFPLGSNTRSVNSVKDSSGELKETQCRALGVYRTCISWTNDSHSNWDTCCMCIK